MKNLGLEYYNSVLFSVRKKTDTLFKFIFLVQWILGIAIALYVSPYVWKGQNFEMHLHLKMAIFMGGIISFLPIWVMKLAPDSAFSRHFVSINQVLFSSMIIHLMGGRIEAHFHVFGSLAFIALYRDWKVLLGATLVVATDHLIRGYIFPFSVYGINVFEQWRWLEHAAWVIFEDIFLIYSIHQGLQAFKENSVQKEEFFHRTAFIENEVKKRTEELGAAQKQLIESAKLASLGHMAGGIAHEINNPLAIITGSMRVLNKSLSSGQINEQIVKSIIEDVESTVKRITRIVVGLRIISREKKETDHSPVLLKGLFEDVLGVCAEKYNSVGVPLEIDMDSKLLLNNLVCDRIQLSQVFINLLSNALDAVENLGHKWVKIEIYNEQSFINVRITDSGSGIPKEIQDKIYNPFFTSKEIGKGTGLGLSISKRIVEQHNGILKVDNTSPNTSFVIQLPYG